MVQQNQFGGAPTEDPNAHLGSFLEICDTIQTFYNGLNGQTRIVVDSAAGGALLSKTLNEAYALLDEIATNSYQWPSESSSAKKVAGLYEVDPITALAAQMSSLTNQIVVLTSHGSQRKSKSIMTTSTAYQKVERENEQLQHVNDQNFNQKGNYSGNNYYQGFNNQAFERKPSLEDILGTFISETRLRFNKDDARLDSIETHMTNLGATMKNLEVQIGQIAIAIQSQQKGQFFSDTEVNSREHCNAITLRGGKAVEERKLREVGVPTLDPILVREKQTEGQKIEARYLKKEFDEKFAKFLEVFKKIHINILFAETLAQMPNYAKFLKEVISKKRKLKEFETVKLTEECSAIFPKKLPHKLKDPSSFNIPCNIGGITFDRALCDFEVSINLMPLSEFKKLGLEISDT
ncbi:uncharacterized protein LOC111376916 [Olea europaea var. sylvestris]|uniref:uncharacterized protein LOC111376916 n=1 Tax=Olea europaea var. sylvestris TaxID=158386 RepID=UPI000C1CFB77|nr:uncharacterized protein LOC111376916 [Olea europaea var. sylvestris]